MNKFTRLMALALAISCLTWVGVLWSWQRSDRAITEVDMAVYLILLPFVLLVSVLALRRAWKKAGERISAQQAAPSLGAARAAGAAAPVAGPSHDEKERHATMRLVHAALVSTGGTQASDVLQAAADGKPLPAPDTLLSGAAGLPVICARLPDAALALDGCRDRLDALARQLGQEDARWQAEQPGEGVVRALAALQEPVLAQRQWLLDLAMRNPVAEDTQDAPLPRVRLLLGCAVHSSLFEQSLAQRWVETLWAGSDNAMDSLYVLQMRVLACSAEDLWLQADRAAHMADEVATPAWLLLAATHSDLDQARIDALESAGRLYEPNAMPGGCMPGEAAVTVLIAPSKWESPEDIAPKSVLLHRPALVQRSKPVEAAGKVDPQVLREAATQAMAAARVMAAQVAALVCDADQHSPRATELYGVTIGDLPQLDPLDDMRVLGKVTGNVGVASCLLVVACASELAQTANKPVLALGMADSRMRLALIVKPDLPEDAAAQESATATRGRQRESERGPG